MYTKSFLKMKKVFFVACTLILLFPLKGWAIIEIGGIGHNYQIEGAPGTFYCSGGYIELVVTGNAGPFAYSWSNGQTSKDAQGLCSGTYTVTVTNAFGCSKVLSAVIMDCPGAITNVSIYASAVTPLSTVGASDGAINISVDGGFTRYYKWTKQGSNQVIATTEDISNLSAGTYCVEITGDCESGTNACYTILACSTISWNIGSTVKNDCDCSGCSFCTSCQDGSIALNVTSPSGLKKYLWSNGATSTSIQNLNAGTYTVTVTDINTGCTTTRAYDIITNQVVVTKIGGCAWKATCGEDLLQYYSGDSEEKLGLQNQNGEKICVSQQYCDGVPVDGTLIPLGPPEKKIDWDLCRGQLVCKHGVLEETIYSASGVEQVLNEGQNCGGDIVKCTITWQDGMTSTHISGEGVDWNACFCALGHFVATVCPGDEGQCTTEYINILYSDPLRHLVNGTWVFTPEYLAFVDGFVAQYGPLDNYPQFPVCGQARPENISSEITQRLNIPTQPNEFFVTQNQQVFIYPNPTTGSFEIELKQESASNPLMYIRIKSVSGVSILYKQVFTNAKVFNLDIASLAPGFYFVETIFEDGTMNINRVVKN